jgi:hypothetical protein
MAQLLEKETFEQPDKEETINRKRCFYQRLELAVSLFQTNPYQVLRSGFGFDCRRGQEYVVCFARRSEEEMSVFNISRPITGMKSSLAPGNIVEFVYVVAVWRYPVWNFVLEPDGFKPHRASPVKHDCPYKSTINHS